MIQGQISVTIYDDIWRSIHRELVRHILHVMMGCGGIFIAAAPDDTINICKYVASMVSYEYVYNDLCTHMYRSVAVYGWPYHHILLCATIRET